MHLEINLLFRPDKKSSYLATALGFLVLYIFVCAFSGWVSAVSANSVRSAQGHAIMQGVVSSTYSIFPADARLLRGWYSGVGITWEPFPWYEEIFEMRSEPWEFRDISTTSSVLRLGRTCFVVGLLVLYWIHLIDRCKKSMKSRQSQELAMIVLCCAGVIAIIPSAAVNALTMGVLGYWSEVCNKTTGMAWVMWSRFSVGAVHAANLALLVVVSLFCQRFVLEFFGRRGMFLPADERAAAKGRCPYCGYNTTGLVGCPECGQGRRGVKLAAFPVKRITRVTYGVLIGIAVIGSFMPLIVGCARGLFLLLRRSISA